MKRTTSLRTRTPINDLLVISKGRKYKAFLIILAILLAYTVGSLHVFTSYAPPSGFCTSTSLLPPTLGVVELPPDKIAEAGQQISEKWGVDLDFAKQVVATASATADKRFPRTEDVLAVVAVESGFNPKAENAGAYGLMQIQYNHHKERVDSKTDLFDPLQNMRAGVKILNEYFHGVNQDPDSAVLAYQAGIGGLFKGEARAEYLAKFKRERAWFKKILRT